MQLKCANEKHKRMKKEKTGLEERLEQILEDHVTNVARFQKQVDDLYAKTKFCTDHNFEEEKRITNVKINQMDMLLYDYKDLFNKIKEALNDWNS